MSAGQWNRSPLVAALVTACSGSPLEVDTPVVLRIVGPTTVLRGSAVSLLAESDTVRPANYDWRIEAQPNGSDLELGTATASTVRFTVDVKGRYGISVGVGGGSVSEPRARWSVDALDNPPIANAGPDLLVASARTVQLDGSASYDPDGEPFTLEWTLLARPEASGATARTDTERTAQLDVDVVGTYRIEVVALGLEAQSEPDTVEIVFERDNQPPVANAGLDRTVTVQETVILDGTGSFDPDGDPLHFFWRVVTSPPLSTARLVRDLEMTSELTPDQPGMYTIELFVNDGRLESSPDQITVTVEDSSQGVASDIFDVSSIYLFGTLRPGSCSYGVIASLSSVEVFAAGFECSTVVSSAIIRPSDGRLLTRDFSFNEVYEFSCDDCTSNAMTYPPDPRSNDAVLDTAPCKGPMAPLLTDFLLGPDDRFIYRCADSPAWYTPGGIGVHPGPVQIRALGANGLALAGSSLLFLVDLDTGLSTALSSPVTGLRSVRTQEDGFRVVERTSPNGGTDRLLHIGPGGEVSMIGVYPEPPVGFFVRSGGVLDPTGRLFEPASDPTNSRDLVIRRSIDGTWEIVYDEITNPTVLMHSSSLVTGP